MHNGAKIFKIVAASIALGAVIFLGTELSSARGGGGGHGGGHGGGGHFGGGGANFGGGGARFSGAQVRGFSGARFGASRRILPISMARMFAVLASGRHAAILPMSMARAALAVLALVPRAIALPYQWRECSQPWRCSHAGRSGRLEPLG